jgi:hypothetical protein
VRVLLAAVVVVAGCQGPTAAPTSSSAQPIFWSVDQPQARGASAFGALPPERQAKRILSIATYQLATVLPTAPPTLNVYVAGAYPDADTARVAIFGEPGWQFTPALSLLQYVGTDRPLGPAGAIGSDAEALARAEAILRPRGVLPPDTQSTRITKDPAGRWGVSFARRIDDRVDYANKGLRVTFDATGQVRNILVRRRPLLERSAYPTRTAQEAWALVQSGRWLTFNLEDGAPTTPAQLDRFVARSVDIVYVEGEVLAPRDIVRPYYVFRDANDQTIYVSAIAGDLP